MYQLLSTRLFIMVVITLFLTACSSSPKHPAWIDGHDVNYSAEVYLTASGQGQDTSVADNRALANLAKIFAVSITDESIDFTKASIKQNNADGNHTRRVDNKQILSRFVNTQAQQVLRGASIVARWKSPISGQQFSLAAMEKAPAAALFIRAIHAADEQTSAAVVYAEKMAPNPLVALSSLERARQRQVVRLNDNNNLRVVTGTGIDVQYSVAALTAMLNTRLAALPLATAATDKQTLVSLQSAVAAVGVQLVAVGQYRLLLTLEQSAIEQRQAWYWLRGNIILQVLDGDNSIASKRWPFKISAQNEALLAPRLHDKLTAVLPDYVYQLLTPEA